MTDSGTGRVTDPEARAAYIAMKGRRSVLAVRKRLGKEGRKTPSETTFENWSAKHRWVALARKHDDKVVTATADKIAKATVAEAVVKATLFDAATIRSLQQALIGLDNIDAENLKASDIRSLIEVSERAAKMFELLEGRATDRPDHMTRARVDAVLEQMKKELEESLANVSAIYH